MKKKSILVNTIYFCFHGTPKDSFQEGTIFRIRQFLHPIVTAYTWNIEVLSSSANKFHSYIVGDWEKGTLEQENLQTAIKCVKSFAPESEQIDFHKVEFAYFGKIDFVEKAKIELEEKIKELQEKYPGLTIKENFNID